MVASNLLGADSFHVDSFALRKSPQTVFVAQHPSQASRLLVRACLLLPNQTILASVCKGYSSHHVCYHIDTGKDGTIP